MEQAWIPPMNMEGLSEEVYCFLAPFLKVDGCGNFRFFLFHYDGFFNFNVRV